MALLADKPTVGPEMLVTPAESSRSSSRTKPAVHGLELQLCNPLYQVEALVLMG